MKRLKRVFLGLAVCCFATGSVLAQGATLTNATLDNGDMIRMQKLAGFFSVAHPDIKLAWVTLDENILRQKVTADIATGGGQCDIVSIGTCEAPLRAERGWLRALDDMLQSHDVDDILPPLRAALSLEGKLYAVPLDGESSFTTYRTDLFEQAGLEMPAAPGWGFIKRAAKAIRGTGEGVYGICLRGKPGWGENMALLTPMVDAYGGRRFDTDWKPQVDSTAWSEALNGYVSLLREYGPAKTVAIGFSETLALFYAG